MTPPIFTPDGTEVEEVILPDGSEAVEVIAPDGTVVFEGVGGPLAIGGRDGGIRDTVYRLDGGSWGAIDPLPGARYGLAATQDPEGRPLAIGGEDGDGDRRDTGYRLDGGSWSAIDPLPEVRWLLAAT